MLLKFTLPMTSGSLLVFAVVHAMQTGDSLPTLAPPLAPATSTPGGEIAARGIVEPQNGSVEVGAPVAGLVAEVFVLAGERIQQDAPLFRLDGRELEAERASRQASLAVARAKLAELEAPARDDELAAARACVAETEARRKFQRDELRRTHSLIARGAQTQSERERHESEVHISQAQIDYAKAKLDRLVKGPTQEERNVARANVAEAQARLAQTERDLERLTVRAPYAALVLRVDVRPTESVTPQSVRPLVVLARDGELFVRVEIEEHELGRFSPQSAARASAKGMPSQSIELRLVRVEPYVMPRPLRNGTRDHVDARVLEVVYSVPATVPSNLFVGQQLDVFVGRNTNAL